MKLRSLWQWIGLAALAALIIFSRNRIGQVVMLLRHVHWYVLILFVAIQLLSYWFSAKYYQSVFAVFGYKIETKFLYVRALTLNFVNQAFPSGGIAGTSYLSNSLGDRVPAGKTTLTQVMNYGFTVVSFLAVLAFGFLLLFLTGNLVQNSVRLILLFILFIIIFGVVVIIIISDRARTEQICRNLIEVANRFSRKFLHRQRPVVTPEQLSRFVEEFYNGYEVMSEHSGHWRLPFLYSLGGNLTEVATVYVVFLAFGHLVNPGAVIAAYTMANIVSLISPITGGAGAYEATMIGTLVALGIPFSVSFPVVLVYRVINFALFLPVGYYYYRQTI